MSDALTSLIGGYQATAVLYAAVELDLPDLIGDAGVPLEELASSTACPPRELERLLRLLLQLDICSETSGLYRVTDSGRLLQRASATPHRDLVRLSVEQYLPAWSDIAGALRSGRSAFKRLHGVGPFEWRADHPRDGQLFVSWLNRHTSATSTDVASGLDLTGVEVVADIGGGLGALLLELLFREEALSGVLVDQPVVLEQASAAWPQTLRHRTSFLPGDLFGDLKVEADAMILKSVLHDWNDENAAVVLRRCAATMSSHTRLLVVERLVNGPGYDPRISQWLDMHMLVITGGRERTVEEYETLLQISGMRVSSVCATGGGFGVIEATVR